MASRTSHCKLLVLTLVVLMLAASVSALHRKQHGARVGEGPAPTRLRQPVAITSKYSIAEGETGGAPLELLFDHVNTTFVVLSSDEDDDDLEVEFQLPGRGRTNANAIAGFKSTRKERVNGASKRTPSRLFAFRNQRPGRAKVFLSRGSGRRKEHVAIVANSRASSVSLSVLQVEVNAVVGQPVTIAASLTDESDGSGVPVSSGSALIKQPRSASRSSTDLVTGEDGATFVRFTPSAPGNHIVRVNAIGSKGGIRIQRTASIMVAVAAQEVHELTGLGMELSTENGATEVKLTIHIDRPPAASATEYLVRVDVFGTNSAGDKATVVTASGLAEFRDGALVLTIQREWFDNAGVTAPYFGEDLEIICAETFNAVFSADAIELPSTFSTIPEDTHHNGLLGFGTESADERIKRMHQGRPPRRRQKRKKSSPAYRLLNTDNVLLVHGYCADSNPWPASHFTNEKYFNDLNANRGHIAFAQLIDQQADAQNIDSCGIVAHSQGGPAAVSLYTYYWSCLDNGNPTRLIQSVGSPYGGTPLATSIADLAEVFGVQCGSNSDLSPNGASSWQSYIPSWARSVTNYYTTSFYDGYWTYDYCNFATDLLLDDPDDGVVEKSRGNFSGAYNRGHKEGWCHTADMADPAQTSDSSRNSAMNSYAQP